MSGTETSSEKEFHLSKKQVGTLALCCSVLFLIAFFWNFPIAANIDSLLRKQLKQIRGCNLDYNSVDTGIFFPKIILKDITLPSECFGRTTLLPDLNIDQANLTFMGPSFSPLGITLLVSTKVAGQEFSFYLAQGLSSQVIKTSDEELNLGKLLKDLKVPLKAKGNIRVNFRAEVEQNRLESITLLAESSNLELPAQNLATLQTPELNLKNFLIKINTPQKNKLNIEEMILGDQNSPVRAKFSGRVNLISKSLDLTGELAFSTKLKQQLPIVDLFFNNYSQKDGFYQLKITGPLSSPKPMPR